MSILGPRIPVSIYLSREDPSITLQASSRRRPSISKRRSVSSMKGLLPLSLPATHPDAPRQRPFINDSLEEGTGGCFPELLAQDLQLSSAVFAAKNMTSGSPISPPLDLTDVPVRTMSCPTRFLTSPYHVPPRIGILDPIQERDPLLPFHSQLGFINNQNHERSSDGASVTATDSSDGVEPPIVPLRSHSITTTATSLTSRCESTLSPADNDASGLSRIGSWIDFDSEDEGVEIADDVVQGFLSPRPSTPQSSSKGPRFGGKRGKKPGAHEVGASDNQDSRMRSYIQGDSRRPMANLSVWQPEPSLDSNAEWGPRHRQTKISSPALERGSSKRKKRRSVQFLPDLSPTYMNRPESSLRSQSYGCPSLNKDDGDSLDSDDDDDSFQVASFHYPRHCDSVFIEPSPPPTPLPTVQAWLDEANQPFQFYSPAEDMAKSVPLPPDVIETLRVSVACFPETMLLSSSLTVETIRSYARKLKHMPRDSQNFGSIDSPSTTRKSIWRRAVTHGRESLAIRLHREPQDDDVDAEVSTSDMLGPQNLWAPLKSVFPNGSDYICDALYAHIVAYNYVCRIPRSQTPLKAKRSSMASSLLSHKDEIPRKAASLLGLDKPQDASSPVPSASRLAKKFTNPLASLGFGRDQMNLSVATSPTHDVAVKNIQAGLLRCITRLIATARMMSEDGACEHIMAEVDVNEADMIFTRALCEIVRMSEEAI